MIIGTVYDAAKLKQMNNPWMQKQENEKKKQEEKKKKEENKNLSPEMRQLLQYEEDMKRIREERPKANIDAKLKSGADLTADEIEYLKKNEPEAYREYEEVKQEKENYKKQLRNCKTKEDVERLKMNKMGRFMAEAKSISQNPNIPKAKKLALMEKLLKKTMAVQQAHVEFTRTSEYHNLPTEEEEQEKKAQKKNEQPDAMTEEAKVSEEELQMPEEEERGSISGNQPTGEKKISQIEETDTKYNMENEYEPEKTAGVQIRLTADFEETREVIQQQIDWLSPVRNAVRK